VLFLLRARLPLLDGFHLLDPTGQSFVGGQEFAELDEGANDAP